MKTQTVINCLIFGLPGFVHTDHGSCFSAKVFKDFLHFGELQQAERNLTIQQGIHKTNAGTKQFGEQSNSCCITEDFQKKLGEMLYIPLDQWFSTFVSLRTGQISKKFGGPVIFLMSETIAINAINRQKNFFY